MGLVRELVPLADPHGQGSLKSPWSPKASLEQNWTSTGRCSFSQSSCWCLLARQTSERHLSPGPLSGGKLMREKLWRDFFSSPSQWWDHRSEKVNPRYPDFKHKKTQQALWLIDNFNPPWVESELAAIAPGTLQSHIFSWHVRLRKHVKAGDHKKTLNIFHEMQQEGVILDKFAFVPVLNACSSLRSLEEGRRVHHEIIRGGCECDDYVATCLVDMYAKCGSIEDAWSVFSKMREHDVVSWNAMIGGYVKTGQALKAMELYRKMQQEGVEPSVVTFLVALNACARVAALEEGRRVHETIKRKGCESNVYVANCVLNMYAKCGSMEDAWSVFNKMREQSVVSWTAMIAGYVKSGQGLKALKLFQRMQQEGVEPNTVTFVRVLNACAIVAALEEGRRIHEQIIIRGCESDIYVGNCLIDMYAKCGSIEEAWTVFNKMQEQDVVSWNAIIGGYVKSGKGLKALELFKKMQQEGVEPDAVTFVGVLNACASVAALEEGRRIHEHIIRRGCESDAHVATCLVDMYVRCGSIEDARGVFNKYKNDAISWNAMIAGYVKSGQGRTALEIFREMQQEGVEPIAGTFVGVLNACASVAALEEGRRIHEQIIRRGYEADDHVATCLVDMYAKCGNIGDAWRVFKKLQAPGVVSWNAMIGGCGMHGHAKKAIGLFKRMGKEGVEMDRITFSCLLSACSHGGLVKEGLRYFKSMTSCHNVLPTTEHYAGMVDLLGRAGRLEEAEGMTKRMPVESDALVWMSLLGACRIYGNIEMAERAARRYWDFDAEKASGHVLLSNIYAAAGKWERSAAIPWKEPGRTWM